MKTIACVVGTTLALAATAAPASAQLPDLPPIIPPGGTDPAPPPPTAPVAPVGQAPGTVMDGLDVARTNSFPDESIVPPLQKRWQVEATPDRQVLAAEGRVYFVDDGSLIALDQADGRQLWRVPLADESMEPVYDSGVIVAGGGTQLVGYDAATGATKWTRAFTRLSGHTAAGGVVYLTDDGRALVTLKVADGSDLWKVNTREFDSAGRPTVDDQRVYVPAECGGLQAYNRADGASLWNIAPGCSSGPTGGRPAVFGGRVYPSEGANTRERFILPLYDPATGANAGTFPGRPELFAGGLGVWNTSSNGSDEATLRAVDPASGAERWKSVRLGSPISVGHDIFGFSTSGSPDIKEFYALDAETGKSFGTIKLDARDLSQSQRGEAGFAVAPGALVVSAGGYISAWESVLRPDPAGITLGFDTAVTAGKRAAFVSMVGTSMKASKPAVRVEIAGWRGGKFRSTRITAPSFRDGSADFAFTPRRNSRVRARVGDAVSNPVTVYVWPNIRFGKFHWVNRRLLRVSHTVKTPGVNLKGARLVMYLDRRKTKTLTRVTSSKLRAAGRGRTRTTMTFRPPRKVGSKDYFILCLQRSLSHGLGYPDNFTRRCGARTIKE